MSGNTILKPGDTLTAAQANSLPLWSEIEAKFYDAIYERRPNGWYNKKLNKPLIYGPNINGDNWTKLVRVGPAVEQLDKPSDYQLADDLHDELLDDAVREGLVANPHAPGSLDWARWAAQHEGVCVGIKRSGTYRWRDGEWNCFWSKKWCGCGPGANIHNHPGPWSIVPDPSVAPVETSDETPVLHIDPALVDKELSAWRSDWKEICGSSVARGINHITLGYYALRNAANERLVEIVKIREVLNAVDDSTIDAAAGVMCYLKEVTADRDRLHAENADLLATAEVLKRERDAMKEEADLLRSNIALLEAERDAAIREIGKSCYSMTYEHAEQIKGITGERDAAIQRAEKAEAERADYLMRFVQADQTASSLQMTCDHFQATIDETLAAAKVVVPEDVQHSIGAVTLLYGTHPHCYKVAKYLESLCSDHIVDANKMVQSTHPEGSRAWAEDAMRQGFSVIYIGSSFYWTNFQPSIKKGHQWHHMAATGWRIHQPAVAPPAEPSVAQLALDEIEHRLNNHDSRIVALEGKG